jgi:hypothetical protein
LEAKFRQYACTAKTLKAILRVAMTEASQQDRALLLFALPPRIQAVKI